MSKAVSNIDEICQVEGIGSSSLLTLGCSDSYELIDEILDVIFIGPNDLALALLGYTPAKYTEPEFLWLINKVVDACKKYDKKVGMLVANGEEARKAKEKYDLVAIGTDVRALQAFLRKEVEAATMSGARPRAQKSSTWSCLLPFQ